jgi:hypothetical protein
LNEVTREELEAKISRLKHELKYANENNRTRNLELDALHYVWCDGGCKYGVHRWQEDTITQEVVDLAVRNTERLVRWHASHKRKNP